MSALKTRCCACVAVWMSAALIMGIVGCEQGDTKSATPAETTAPAEPAEPTEAATAAEPAEAAESTTAEEPVKPAEQATAEEPAQPTAEADATTTSPEAETAAKEDEPAQESTESAEESTEESTEKPTTKHTVTDAERERLTKELHAKIEAMKKQLAEQQKAKPGELNAQLDKMAQASEERFSEGAKAVMQAGRDAVADSGLLEDIVGLDDTAPDFELPSTAGGTIKLSDLLANGPVVITFYRGGWCPYCNATLAAYNQHADEIKAAGAHLIAISPEIPEHAAATASRHKLSFPVLSDAGNQVAKEYGLVYQLTPELTKLYDRFMKLRDFNGDDSNTLPLAATYVIDPKGVVRYVFADADYRKRAEPADVIKVVQELSSATK